MHSVLVVEDFAAVREVLFHILSHSYECVAVGSAEGALSLLASRRFDLLITDVGLPGASGLALLGEVRRRWPGMPVLVTSGGAAGACAEEYLGQGASGHLLKPFTVGDVERAVRRALARGAES